MTATPAVSDTAAAPRDRPRRMALFALLGFSAGLPYYMFSAVLAARLVTHDVGIVLVGFFGWIQLLPTFKWLWAPLVDRYAVPGFGRFWGARLSWIMLAQLGISAALAAMALTAGDADLRVTALFGTLLAFWTTTLEIASDAWRVELGPTPETQAPLTAASLWGYRSAMIASGSGALILADHGGWGWAYAAVALVAAAALPLLFALGRAPSGSGERWVALVTGLLAGAAILLASMAAVALAGWAVLAAAMALGIGPRADATRVVLILALLPFVALALALPHIRRLPADAPLRRSAALEPYVDIFWRYGYATLPVLGFVSMYRMGDVMTLALSKPVEIAAGYDLTAMGVADGAVALPASLAGVALGAWLAVRLRLGWALAIGAAGSALGNWVFVWLWRAPPSALVLYASNALDQFAHGMEGAVFVVYLSMIVNPRYPAAQYAFLSGFAFLLPRLIAGASGAIQQRIGWDGFFWLSGALSLAAVLFLPIVARVRPRIEATA